MNDTSSKCDIQIITPEEESLIDIVDPAANLCPIKGCDKVMRNSSALRMHVVKSHGDNSLSKSNDGKTKMYACPVKGCPRHAQSPRQQFFTILYRLKRHYQAVHAEKKYKCSRCGKMFGNGWLCSAHEDRCQKLFYCSCGVYYTTMNAVQTHAKRKGHEVIGEKTDDSQSKEQSREKQLKITKEGSITVPAVLYIPSASFKPHNGFTGMNVNCINVVNTDCENTGTSNIYTDNIFTATSTISTVPGNVYGATPQKLIRILPKTVVGSNAAIGVKKTISNEPNIGSYTVINTTQAAAPPEPPQLAVNCSVDMSKVNSYFPVTTKQRKKSVYERNISYLASQEAQQVLSDPVLLHDTILNDIMQKQIRSEIREKTCKCRKYPCKHMMKKRLALSERFTQTMCKNVDSYNELGSSARHLADICTQTSFSFKGIDEPKTADQSSQESQHLDTLTSIEVLETSDFSIQCQMPLAANSGLLSTDSIASTDIQTQTEDLNSWLNTFTFPDCSNMETQTNLLTENSLTQTDFTQNSLTQTDFTQNSLTQTGFTQNSLTQTDFTQNSLTQTDFIETGESIFLNKSVQLDYIWDHGELRTDNNLFTSDSSNIGTQTALEDNWFDHNFQISSEQQSTSTQTNLYPDYDIFGVDLLAQKKDQASQYASIEAILSGVQTSSISMNHNNQDMFHTMQFCAQTVADKNSTSSSGTQTLDYIDSIFDRNSNHEKSHIETQTSISFYDLLDSSFIDDYLNEDKEMTTIETQTVCNVYGNQSKDLVNIETQTDYQNQHMDKHYHNIETNT